MQFNRRDVKTQWQRSKRLQGKNRSRMLASVVFGSQGVIAGLTECSFSKVTEKKTRLHGKHERNVDTEGKRCREVEIMEELLRCMATGRVERKNEANTLNNYKCVNILQFLLCLFSIFVPEYCHFIL